MLGRSTPPSVRLFSLSSTTCGSPPSNYRLSRLGSPLTVLLISSLTPVPALQRGTSSSTASATSSFSSKPPPPLERDQNPSRSARTRRLGRSRWCVSSLSAFVCDEEADFQLCFSFPVVLCRLAPRAQVGTVLRCTTTSLTYVTVHLVSLGSYRALDRLLLVVVTKLTSVFSRSQRRLRLEVRTSCRMAFSSVLAVLVMHYVSEGSVSVRDREKRRQMEKTGKALSVSPCSSTESDRLLQRVVLDDCFPPQRNFALPNFSLSSSSRFTSRRLSLSQQLKQHKQPI